ncbi:hypothetical protein TELCIR_10705 [Teladorsagia circumcincta]|uniref:Uncharacterized protein n=1 Tax=Teladorsagia circumcincta TaxID=45464 RepID=A0A2G9UBD1_TELCI|nr:hypothetical protein TELCIR_10705 [Teladorsagia circumcincta]
MNSTTSEESTVEHGEIQPRAMHVATFNCLECKESKLSVIAVPSASVIKEILNSDKTGNSVNGIVPFTTGLLTLDPRKKERSKVNQPGARAKWIWRKTTLEVWMLGEILMRTY